MVKLRTDTEGCGCVRCQQVDGEALRRSVAGMLRWSTRIVIDRPSIPLVFLGVAFLQLFVVLGPGEFALAGAIAGVAGVFAGRGYIGVVGRDVLAHREPSAADALRTVLRRFPAFVGAAILVVALLVSVGLFVARVLSQPARVALETAGVSTFATDVVVLLAVAASVVYLLLKFWFVPEACFVGGYGPAGSLRASWRLTSLHRRKVFLVLSGFALLLGVGVALDTRLADPGSPIALSLRYGETTVVLQSFGLSFAGGVRLAFDMAVTTLYSGVFVHQYVSGAFEAPSDA
jgi:hypothetical protein